jgi:hypothetical protein
MSIDNCQQCKCSLRTALVGDGCDVCNPAQALEYCRENLAEAEAERDKYKALAGELADVLQFIKRGNDCWCIANTADKRLVFHTHECNEVRLALAKYDCSIREQQEKGV